LQTREELVTGRSLRIARIFSGVYFQLSRKQKTSVSPMDEFKIETEAGQSSTIVRITGPLTLTTLFDFQNALRREASAITIIDLSAVPYIDSAALGSLLGFHVSCEQKGRRYALAGTSQRLEGIFQVTRV